MMILGKTIVYMFVFEFHSWQWGSLSVSLVLRLHNSNKIITNRNDLKETPSVPVCVSLLRVAVTNVCSVLAMVGGEFVNMITSDL